MGILPICMNMKVLISLVAIGILFVCFVVFCSQQSCVSTWVSFNCLLSQANVKDYGGLFFFFKLTCHCASLKS